MEWLTDEPSTRGGGDTEILTLEEAFDLGYPYSREAYVYAKALSEAV